MNTTLNHQPTIILVLDQHDIQLYHPLTDKKWQLAIHTGSVQGAFTGDSSGQDTIRLWMQKLLAETMHDSTCHACIAYYAVHGNEIPSHFKASIAIPAITSATWIDARNAAAIGSNALVGIADNQGVVVLIFTPHSAHASIFSHGDFVYSRSVIFENADEEDHRIAMAGLLKMVLDRTPPSLLASVYHNGCVMVGESIPANIERDLSEAFTLPVRITDRPERAIIRGCMKMAGIPE